MSQEIIAIQNVHGYVDDNGMAWLNVEDVARGLGFVEVMKDRAATTGGNFPTSIRWRRINDYLCEFGFYQQVGKGDFIPENMVYLLKNQVICVVSLKGLKFIFKKLQNSDLLPRTTKMEEWLKLCTDLNNEESVFNDN